MGGSESASKKGGLKLEVIKVMSTTGKGGLGSKEREMQKIDRRYKLVDGGYCGYGGIGGRSEGKRTKRVFNSRLNFLSHYRVFTIMNPQY